MLNRPDNIVAFQSALASWFSDNQRNLPWRESKHPYHVWVSEVMLQQTQVKTMLPYFDRFILKYPDLEHFAAARLESVLKSWEGLGYYARARNFHKAAQMVCKEMNSIIPDSPETFKTLPGVGDYICAAVQSIAFNRTLAVVDGNVKRVLARVFCMDIAVNIPKHHKRFQQQADLLLDKSDPGTHNQAMMELGALICTPKNPLCESCPAATFCLALSRDKIEKYPVRKAAKKVPVYAIAAGVVFRQGKMLITRRKPEGLLGGLWEFPGGKIKTQENAQQACIREIKEETGLDITVTKHLTSVKHAYTHFKIHMDVYICEFQKGEVRLNGPVDYRWANFEELAKFAFPKANNKFIPLLKNIKSL